MALESCDTHLPKALRSLAFLPYFSRNGPAPISARSALQDRAAFSVFWRASSDAAFAFEETHLPKAF